MARKPIKFSLEYSKRVYSPRQIDDVVPLAIKPYQNVHGQRSTTYYNIPCSFDIETSSFYIDQDGNTRTVDERIAAGLNADTWTKGATMYVWQFGINGYVIIGRTWPEFTAMLDRLSQLLNLEYEHQHLIVYVHNLAYEFQFMRKWFIWEKVFAPDHKPLYAITQNGIEFKCSYLLSGYSLNDLGKQLTTYKVEKKVGDLDYSLIRHSETPLTDTEIGYCVNDVLVVMAYIQEQIEQESKNHGSIATIPLTKTGYVRKYCRKNCLQIKNGKYPNMGYVKRISELTITDDQEYDMLKRAFQGGFTHANPFYSGLICENIASYDFASSYPYVMLSEKFPMSRGVLVNLGTNRDDVVKNFKLYLNDYLSVFDVRFENLTPKITYENYISKSKCFELSKDAVENNGRIVSASYLSTTITNIDFGIISDMYKWDTMTIGNMLVYRKDYLPKEFVLSILKLYEDKTKLKGVKGKEVEYLVSKGMLNACFGMSVTDIIRPEINYIDGEWVEEDPDKQTQLDKYNNSRNRFLYYPWGIFVTAYARKNLFNGIIACGDDYRYSDTDSIKIANHENHLEYFENYNKLVKAKLTLVAAHFGIEVERFEPSNIKGEKQLIGVWDYEGVSTRFKTLGAKRYLEEKDLEDPKQWKIAGTNISMTVSGVNKYAAIPSLISKYTNDEIFNMFKDGLVLNHNETGKMIHTYINREYENGQRKYFLKVPITDYLGNKYVINEASAVHLEPTEFTLGIGEAYKMYVQGLREDIKEWQRRDY